MLIGNDFYRFISQCTANRGSWGLMIRLGMTRRPELDFRDSLWNEGLGKIIVNGLEPQSNRMILKMAEDYDVVQAALGIYPLEACHKFITEDLPFSVVEFDVDSEIKFIEECAQKGLLTAVGECGLDAYWVGEGTFAEQERVFEQLIDIATRHQLPIIIHYINDNHNFIVIKFIIKLSIKKISCW